MSDRPIGPSMPPLGSASPDFLPDPRSRTPPDQACRPIAGKRPETDEGKRGLLLPRRKVATNQQHLGPQKPHCLVGSHRLGRTGIVDDLGTRGDSRPRAFATGPQTEVGFLPIHDETLVESPKFLPEALA